MSAAMIPMAAIAATIPPTTAAVCDEVVVVLEFVVAFVPEPLAVVDCVLGGSSPTAEMGCVPICPFPTITSVPLLGIPWTVTNKNAGPGCKRLGLGGA